MLTLALVLGLVTGMLQGGVYTLRSAVFNGFTWMPREVLWMSPLANAWWIGGAGLCVALLHMLLPRIVTLRVVLFVLLSLSALSLAFLATKIHPLAQIVLSLGVGAWLSGLAEPRSLMIRSRMRRWLVALCAMVLAMALGFQGWRTWREHRALAAVPPAPAGSVNVLFLLLDTVRAQNLSLYGYNQPTSPVLDSLAASSTVFDAAWAPSSWTLPSHASMFTGVLPLQTGTDWRDPFDTTLPVLAERFQAAGYATGGFVANLAYTHRESGLARGFQRYVDHRATVRQILMTSEIAQVPVVHEIRYAASWRARLASLRRFELRRELFSYSPRKRAPEVVREFLDWEAGRDRPFFAFLNFFDAHEPYGEPGPWRDSQSGPPTPMERYDGGIRRIDASLGALFDALRERGVLDRTIIVVTSDHGDQFNDHGLTGHGNSLYAQLLRVPLLIHAPDGLGAGVRVATAVSLLDLGATMLELSGADARGFPGRSLVPALRGQPVNGSPVISGFGGLRQFDPTFDPETFLRMRSVATDDWHLIRREDGRVELFNVRRDPDELVDLADDAAYAVIRDSLRRVLAESAPDPAIDP
ncbi:MAG TPA: sulfatase [Gemmatimonadaceae bacterium]|nr:sulfatase [Gemmatimonadaceae bacterium]